MRRIRAMSLGIELIINNGVSSSGRIPDITGEASQVNSILADRLRKSKLCMKKDKALSDMPSCQGRSRRRRCQRHP